jgi:hypothetical protein
MNPQSQNITLGSHTLCPNCADDIQFQSVFFWLGTTMLVGYTVFIE